MLKEKVEEMKRLRGHILNILSGYYGGNHEFSCLKSSLKKSLHKNGYSGADVDFQVMYLKDKGYIKSEAAQLTEPDELIRITAVGIDLIEETTSDAGVEI